MQEQIKIINQSLQSIINQMHELLSQPHLDLNVEIGHAQFIIRNPDYAIDKDEYAFLEGQRYKLIYTLLNECFSVLLNNMLFAEESDPWSRILALNQLIVRKEDIVSPIAAEEYEVVKSEAEKRGSIALNEEAYQVKNELQQ